MGILGPGSENCWNRCLPWHSWLKKVWADGGYSGEGFEQWVRELRPGLEVENVKRSDYQKGFKVLPNRWVVERTLAWLVRCKHRVRDYEATESSATTLIYLALIRIMFRRLA